MIGLGFPALESNSEETNVKKYGFGNRPENPVQQKLKVEAGDHYSIFTTAKQAVHPTNMSFGLLGAKSEKKSTGHFLSGPLGIVQENPIGGRVVPHSIGASMHILGKLVVNLQ